MSFDPDSISQDDLQDLQRAAELAWGEDVRHPSFQGHPDPSQGSCYITSRWLQKRLGGFVGAKKGHFFWVSPDKQYVVDLTGDKFSRPPIDTSIEGRPDENGETIVLDPHHKRWSTGPSVYVRSNHPLYRDFRVIEDSPHQRAERFANRADAYMRGGSVKQADLLGPTPYPGSTPEKQEEWENNSPLMHDEPTSVSDPSLEYKFVIANGRLHVSPVDSHEDLLDRSGVDINSNGPIAVGYGYVDDGNVTWTVTSNISLKNVHELLEQFSDNMGWSFEGMLDSQGNPIDDSFGPKRSMWYVEREDGHTIMAHTPLPRGNRIDIIGKVAYTPEIVGPARAAINDWAQDFGYHLASYPGGGNMLDLMKNMPHLDQYNLGDQDAVPDEELGDIDQVHDLKCGECGKRFNSINELILHDKDHQPWVEEVDQNDFPWPQDSDAPLGFGTWPYPAETEGSGSA